MKKELVSLDTIRKDIQNYCLYDLKKLRFPFIITLIWAGTLIALILFFPIFLAVKIVVIALAIGILLITAIYLLKKRHRYRKIINTTRVAQFEIVLDTLEDHILNHEPYATKFLFMIEGVALKTKKPYRLKFYNSGEYEVPLCENYVWSNNCKISGAGLFRLSQKGEEFYLVRLDNKIIMVYSTKFFELDNLLKQKNT